MLKNQNHLVCLLGLLLILLVVCKQQNKSVLELFGIAGAGSNGGAPEASSTGGGAGKPTGAGGDNTILFFHANWCGHCQAFKPEWSKFEKWAGENGQKVEAVEGDSNPELCQKYNIEGYPTILKVDSNGEVVDEYQGPRTSDGLKQFC